MPQESTLEMILRIATGVIAACSAIAVLLSIVWVTTDEESTGSWAPVVPWIITCAVSLILFVVLLARSRARHAATTS